MPWSDVEWQERRCAVHCSLLFRIDKCLQNFQITKLAIERNQELRAQFLYDVGIFSADQFVFVDESSIDRRTTQRHYGWAQKGERAVMHGNFVRGDRWAVTRRLKAVQWYWRILYLARYSLLPALSLNGIIHLRIFEGSVNGTGFLSFITQLLDVMNPFPGPNSVLILDNCSIHKGPEVRELVEGR